jgi:hypothetical protein
MADQQHLLRGDRGQQWDATWPLLTRQPGARNSELNAPLPGGVIESGCSGAGETLAPLALFCEVPWPSCRGRPRSTVST